MSEAVQIALINNAPLILTALGTALSAFAGFWSVIRSGKALAAATDAQAESKATKAEVNGGLSKMLKALEAAHQADTKASRAEALGEAALKTAGAQKKTVVVQDQRRGQRRKAEPETP